MATQMIAQNDLDRNVELQFDGMQGYFTSGVDLVSDMYIWQQYRRAIQLIEEMEKADRLVPAVKAGIEALRDSLPRPTVEEDQMQIVTIISRYTSAGRSAKAHADDGSGRPLCNETPRGRFNGWSQDEGAVTCPRCLSMMTPSASGVIETNPEWDMPGYMGRQ